MRTTWDIAEDVLQAAKELARRPKLTAGQVISDLAREAMTRPASRFEAAGEAGAPEEFFGFKPLAPRGVVTNELIDQLRDEDVY